MSDSLRLTSANTNWAQLHPDIEGMFGYRFCSWKIWALHSRQRHCRSAIRPQAIDVKPLMSIFTKPILTSPKRLQQMRLRLQKYMKKKDSDRKSKKQIWKKRPSSQTNVSSKFAKKLTRMPPCKPWCHWSQLVDLMKNCRPYRDELSTQNGLVFRGTRTIIAHSMRTEMTLRAHCSHLGIQYTINTARDIMYWPRMTADLTEALQRCETCQQIKPALPKEPMMT